VTLIVQNDERFGCNAVKSRVISKQKPTRTATAYCRLSKLIATSSRLAIAVGPSYCWPVRPSVRCPSRGHILKTKQDRPIVTITEVSIADSVATFRSSPNVTPSERYRLDLDVSTANGWFGLTRRSGQFFYRSGDILVYYYLALATVGEVLFWSPVFVTIFSEKRCQQSSCITFIIDGHCGCVIMRWVRGEVSCAWHQLFQCVSASLLLSLLYTNS